MRPPLNRDLVCKSLGLPLSESGWERLATLAEPPDYITGGGATDEDCRPNGLRKSDDCAGEVSPNERELSPAERVGFEPTVAQRTTTVFETAPINHSGTSPCLSNDGQSSVTGDLPRTVAGQPSCEHWPSSLDRIPRYQISTSSPRAGKLTGGRPAAFIRSFNAVAGPGSPWTRKIPFNRLPACCAYVKR